MVEPPGYLPVTAELQIHLLDTILLKEGSVHRFYEITRASSAAVFLAEAKCKGRATGSAPPSTTADPLANAQADPLAPQPASQLLSCEI